MTTDNRHEIGIILNGVTGRMGLNQHLRRSLYPLVKAGGLQANGETFIVPKLLLVGRNAARLREISQECGGLPCTTDLAAALSDPAYSVYFDAQTTDRRAQAVKDAIAAGKHVYCEKPISENVHTALDLYHRAQRAGVRHGVVQDKLWLPGLQKLQNLMKVGFFGDMLSVRGEFGYWVFEGNIVPAQRPSWNYRKEDGGGIIIDMLCHWRYILDNVFGKVQSVSCLGATHIPSRWDESGQPYRATADDAAYATFQLENGIVAQFNSAWTVRVRRDDLLTLQVDGTKGSAVAGLRDCWVQHYGSTPRPTWNPDIPQPINFFETWQLVPEQQIFDNAFKRQWELFLRHVVLNEPFPWNFLEAAKGVQLAEAGLQSWRERRWIDIPPIS